MIMKQMVSLLLQVAIIFCVSSVSDGFGMMFMTNPSRLSSSSKLAAPTSEENGVFGVNLKFTLQTGRREDFLSLIKENQKKTLDLEPGALQYVVGEDVDSPNTFYLHKEFIDDATFDAHCDLAVDWITFKNSKPFTEDGGEPKYDFYNEVPNKHNKDGGAPKKIPIRPAFCLHVELCVKPEMREEFLKVIDNNQKGSTQDEPLCLQYTYGESAMTHNKFIFHEQYQGNDGGKEGFDAHTQAPHFLAWEQFVQKDPLTEPPVVYFYKTL